MEGHQLLDITRHGAPGARLRPLSHPFGTLLVLVVHQLPVIHRFIL